MELKKVGTPECQLFIAAYYAQSQIDTDAQDWVLQKKYKNFNGFTCRDFYNNKIEVKAIVVAEPGMESYRLKVLENSSYKNYLEQMSKGPLFYYAPVITSDGLCFYFEKAVTFDATSVLDSVSKREKQHPYLLKKLELIFKEEDIISFHNDMVIMFPILDKYSLEEIIQKLERNNLTYNEKIYQLLDNSDYIPFQINTALYIHDFPEDNLLDMEKAIEAIFSIVSRERNLLNKDYARVHKLLKKVTLEEILNIKEIILGFRPNDNKKLNDLITLEINEKENKILLNKIYR